MNPVELSDRDRLEAVLEDMTETTDICDAGGVDLLQHLRALRDGGAH